MNIRKEIWGLQDRVFPVNVQCQFTGFNISQPGKHLVTTVHFDSPDHLVAKETIFWSCKGFLSSTVTGNYC